MIKEEYHYPVPRDDVKSIQQAIQKIRFEKKEHLYVFKKGMQVRRFVGEKSYVNIPIEYLFELKDSTVVHNHPSNTTFSIDDVQSAVKYDVFQLYVVTNYFFYSIKRPEKGWGFDFEEKSTLQTLNSCEKNSRETIEKLSAQFHINHEEKEYLFLHYFWVFFFNMFNIEYERREIKQNSV